MNISYKSPWTQTNIKFGRGQQSPSSNLCGLPGDNFSHEQTLNYCRQIFFFSPQTVLWITDRIYFIWISRKKNLTGLIETWLVTLCSLNDCDTSVSQSFFVFFYAWIHRNKLSIKMFLTQLDFLDPTHPAES